MNTYSKLRDGNWGLRGPDLAAGQTVTVTKRSGETKTETVGQVLWTGQDGTCLATIAAGNGAQPRRGGWYECDDCGERVLRGSRCWETGLGHA